MHRYLTRAALFALGGAVAVAATGCVTIERGGPGTAGSAPTSSVPATGDAGLGSAPPDETAATPDPTGSPAGKGGKPGGGSSGGGNTGNTGGGSDHSGTTSKKPSGPTIVYYRIKQKPQCDQGTNVNRIPGVPVILEWKVTGADEVTISVDGPGIYNTYPAVGTATIDFSCGGSPGEYAKHTYQLRTVGGGEVRSKTLSASALIHEIPQV